MIYVYIYCIKNKTERCLDRSRYLKLWKLNHFTHGHSSRTVEFFGVLDDKVVFIVVAMILDYFQIIDGQY